MSTVCKICLAKHGLKAWEIKDKTFATDDELFDHLENAHGQIVMREYESAKEAEARCAAKGIVSDRLKCQCQDCKDWRAEMRKMMQ